MGSWPTDSPGALLSVTLLVTDCDLRMVSVDDNAYEVWSDGGRYLGVVHQVAPDLRESRYTKASRELEITATWTCATKFVVSSLSAANSSPGTHSYW